MSHLVMIIQEKFLRAPYQWADDVFQDNPIRDTVEHLVEEAEEVTAAYRGGRPREDLLEELAIVLHAATLRAPLRPVSFAKASRSATSSKEMTNHFRRCRQAPALPPVDVANPLQAPEAGAHLLALDLQVWVVGWQESEHDALEGRASPLALRP